MFLYYQAVFATNYIVLNSGKCHFMLSSVQKKWVIWPDLQWYYTKTQQPQNIFRLTIDNERSSDDRINICRTANKSSMLSVQ